MQIFSPLVMDVACKMTGSVQEPLFISLPEFKSATVNQLMELLLRGQIMEFRTENIEDVKRNVIHLAESLGIMMKIDPED